MRIAAEKIIADARREKFQARICGKACLKPHARMVLIKTAGVILVGNSVLTLANWHGVSGSLRYRHISNYRLDAQDAGLRASGLDVLDVSKAKRIQRWVDFNLSIDNLTNKVYFETQNYFESRLRPGDPIIARIHGTPGYPFGVTAGLTFRLFGK